MKGKATTSDSAVERAADDAWVGRLGVAKLAGLVHGFAGQAEVSDGRFNVPLRNVEVPCPTMPGYLAPLLRRVVLIRQPPFGLRLDFQRIGLGAVGRY